MSALKKYLLGVDQQHLHPHAHQTNQPDGQSLHNITAASHGTFGEGLGIYTPMLPRKPSDDTAYRQGTSINRDLGPSPNSEAAFQRSLQVLRDPTPMSSPLPPPVPPSQAQFAARSPLPNGQSRSIASPLNRAGSLDLYPSQIQNQDSKNHHSPRIPATPTGTRAPRSSKATEILSSSPLSSRSSRIASSSVISTKSSIISRKGMSPMLESTAHPSPAAQCHDGSWREDEKATAAGSDWRDLDIPVELGEVDDDYPIEIRGIVHDTMEMHRALQLSRLQASLEDLESMSGSSGFVNDEAGSDSSNLIASRRADRITQNKSRARRASSVADLLEPERADKVSPLRSGNDEHVEYAGRDRTSRSKGLYNLFKRHRVRAKPAEDRVSTASLEATRCDHCDGEHVDSAIRLSCQHTYCASCFQQHVLAQASMEATFPPSCCTLKISKTTIRKYLQPAELISYEARSVEYALSPQDRVYCADSTCATWIDLRKDADGSGRIKCPSCLQAKQMTEEDVEQRLAAILAAKASLDEKSQTTSLDGEKHNGPESEAIRQQDQDRIDRITEHYAELRAILDHVGLQQHQKIDDRHRSEITSLGAMEERFGSKIAQREKEIQAEQQTMISEHEKAIKGLQKRHAAEMVDTIHRHRQDQDELMKKSFVSHARDLQHESTSLSGQEELPTPLNRAIPSHDQDMIRALALESLMPLQEMERSTLKNQQTRELEKWKHRGTRALQASNVTLKIQQMRLDEEENLARTTNDRHNQHDADLRWFDLIHSERADALANEERQMVLSGGDIPSSNLPLDDSRQSRKQSSDVNSNSSSHSTEELDGMMSRQACS